ncbi:MAG: hypothetical protein QXJ74_05275 [Nitrososphaera sp.]
MSRRPESMGKYSYLKRATIDFAELFDKVKAEAQLQGKSVNEYVKAAVAAFVNGEVVQTSKLFAGDDSDQCVYGIEGCEACPLRKRFPELRKGENLLALKKFCADCSLNTYAHEKAKAKARLEVKYPQVFKQQETTEEPPAAAPAKQVEDITLKCDDCEQTVSLSDFMEFKSPVLAMRNGLLYHVRGGHGRYNLSAKEWPPHMVQRLKAE